ncbi:MAG: hypothetical protein ACK5CA_08050 [Cyanobacteriota bacterium]|jgi:hypothetical protein
MWSEEYLYDADYQLGLAQSVRQLKAGNFGALTKIRLSTLDFGLPIVV